jgi:hypothetical protein
MVHPLVRADEAEAKDLVSMFNSYLIADGYEIVERTRVSGRPIYMARRRHDAVLHLTQAKRVAEQLSSDYLSRQITRMETAIDADPALAIGTAKEFVESVCKGVLAEKGQPASGQETLPQLVKKTRDLLGLSISSRTQDTLRQLLSGLGHITQGVAELRGQLGSGHGHHPDTPQPDAALARLSVSTAIALGIFLFDVHRRTGEAREVGEFRRKHSDSVVDGLLERVEIALLLKRRPKRWPIECAGEHCKGLLVIDVLKLVDEIAQIDFAVGKRNALD